MTRARTSAVGRAMLALLPLLACAPDVTVIAPPMSSARAAVLIQEVDGDVHVDAITWPPEPGIHANATARLRIYLYEDELTTLQVGGVPSCALLHPLATYSLGSADDTLALTEVEPVASDLDHLVPDQAARCYGCRELEQRSVGLAAAGYTGTPDYGWLMSDDRLLMLRGLMPSRILTADGVVTEAPESCRGVFPTYNAAHQASDRLWAPLGAEGLGLVRVGADGECTVERRVATPFVATPTSAFSIAASAPDEPLELFTLGNEGALYRIDDSGAERIATLDLSPAMMQTLAETGGVNNTPVVRRLGPGEILATVAWDRVLHWRRGAARTHRFSSVATVLQRVFRVSDIQVTALSGPLVSFSDGTISRFDEGEFTNYLGGLGDGEAVSFRDYRGGLLFFFRTLSRGGIVQRYHPKYGLCPQQVVLGATNALPRLVFQQGDGFMIADLIDSSNSGVEPAIVYLR